MQENALKELFLEELRDIYSAEQMLTKALPKMAKAATSDDLRAGFEEHLQQTKGHVQRLEEIFERLDEKPTGKKCKGMEGLIEEGEEMIDNDDLEDEARDAGLIGAAQRVEHYEIAAYGTVRTFANILGDREAVSLLESTLEEEKETDQKLTQLSEHINLEAAEEGEMAEGEEMEDEVGQMRTRASSGRNGRASKARSRGRRKAA
jgi:ferritin-like metal-binding protein YciE